MQTAHSEKIYSLAFPVQYGEVFATCSAGGIRVWHLTSCRELLRIRLPNLDCRCVAFAPVSRAMCSNSRVPGSARCSCIVHVCMRACITARPHARHGTHATPQDGKTIISGWSDGKIRGLGPQSGKLLYTINDAHHKAVSALAATSDSARIISGGEEGALAAPARVQQSALQSARACACTADAACPGCLRNCVRALMQAWCASGGWAKRAHQWKRP